MALNPLRESLGRTIHRPPQIDSPFRPVADAALGAFRAKRIEAERRVGTGDLTLKAAREEVEQASAALRDDLARRSDQYSPVGSIFADRLADGAARRAEASRRRSAEDLQRETIDLLRRGLIEQQIASRAAEFEASTHVRPIAGGLPSTSIDRMLAFHDEADHGGDEAGREWARRQLESLRGRAFDEEDQLKIDHACQRPHQVNERLVAASVADLQGRSDGEIDVFVTHALERLDATACVAAFIVARRSLDPIGRPWVRRILDAVDRFPDAALTSLGAWETRERADEAHAARLHAEYVAEVAASEAKLRGLRAPTDLDLARLERLATRPLAAPSGRFDRHLGSGESSDATPPAGDGLETEEPIDP